MERLERQTEEQSKAPMSHVDKHNKDQLNMQDETRYEENMAQMEARHTEEKAAMAKVHAEERARDEARMASMQKVIENLSATVLVYAKKEHSRAITTGMSLAMDEKDMETRRVGL